MYPCCVIPEPLTTLVPTSNVGSNKVPENVLSTLFLHLVLTILLLETE